jgi:hypothetical protein
MRCVKQWIGLVSALVLAGCRDAGRLSGPRLGPPVALAGGLSNPVLFYSTYLGGTGDDDGAGIVVDADGYAYVIGETSSADFPTTAGAFRPTRGGLNDVFVAKVDPAGSGLVYATYVGGTGDDAGAAIAVDAAGNAYLTGKTASNDFPTTAGAFQPSSLGRLGNTTAAFVAKLNATGSALLYSTYLGGDNSDEAGAIAVDQAGNAYVTGVAISTAFPITSGAVQAPR